MLVEDAWANLYLAHHQNILSETAKKRELNIPKSTLSLFRHFLFSNLTTGSIIFS